MPVNFIQIKQYSEHIVWVKTTFAIFEVNIRYTVLYLQPISTFNIYFTTKNIPV